MTQHERPLAWRGNVPLYSCIERCGRLTPYRSRLCDLCAKELRKQPAGESFRDFRRRLKGSS